MRNQTTRFRLGFALLLSAWATQTIAAAAESRTEKASSSSKAASGKPAEVLSKYYDPDTVQSIELRISDADLKRMHDALPKRIYVPASFRWRDVSFDKVAVRYKGNSSSSPRQRYKRSFLVRFDKYKKKQRFFGLRRVSFDNAIQFGSLFSEPILTGILRDLGHKTYRCNYARLSLNGKPIGVYVNVERIDESFIENHLSGAKGSLYKVDEGGPGCNLQFIGDDPSLYEKAFEAKNKSAKKNRDKLVEFIRTINQAKKSDVVRELESRMEFDDFLQVTAVMLLGGAFDQLTGFGPHNYYLFHDAKTNRWRYLPWDLDVGFAETAFGRIRVLADWHAAWPVPPGRMPNPLLERIVADPVLLKRYRKVAREILQKYFEPNRLCALIDAKYALIKDDLKNDPFPPRRVTVPTDRSYDDIVASMKTFVRKRHASALAQLNKPGTRPKLVYKPSPREIVHRRLAPKVRRMQQRLRAMRAKGEDISEIEKLLKVAGPLLDKGKFAEGEKIIDQVLRMMGEKPMPPEKKPKQKR